MKSILVAVMVLVVAITATAAFADDSVRLTQMKERVWRLAEGYVWIEKSNAIYILKQIYCAQIEEDNTPLNPSWLVPSETEVYLEWLDKVITATMNGHRCDYDTGEPKYFWGIP